MDDGGGEGEAAARTAVVGEGGADDSDRRDASPDPERRSDARLATACGACRSARSSLVSAVMASETGAPRGTLVLRAARFASTISRRPSVSFSAPHLSS